MYNMKYSKFKAVCNILFMCPDSHSMLELKDGIITFPIDSEDVELFDLNRLNGLGCYPNDDGYMTFSLN